jgi:hypothetical protein
MYCARGDQDLGRRQTDQKSDKTEVKLTTEEPRIAFRPIWSNDAVSLCPWDAAGLEYVEYLISCGDGGQQTEQLTRERRRPGSGTRALDPKVETPSHISRN